MKQRLSESILSAFLDGEVTPLQHARLAKAIERKPNLKRKVEELRRISKTLSQLAKVPVPPSVQDEALQRVRGSSNSVADLAEKELQVVLLSYAYGELDSALAEEIESLLLHDGQTRDEVRHHRRIARALTSLKRSAPAELIEQLSGKLKEVGAEWLQSDEVAVSSSDSTRLRRAVSALPRSKAPPDLMPRLMDEIRLEATIHRRPARPRRTSFGWAWAGIALSMGLIAILSPALLEGNRQEDPVHAPEEIASSHSSESADDTKLVVDFTAVDDWEKFGTENPSALADAIDSKQVTFAVDDVDRVLQEIEETVGKIDIKESEPTLADLYPAYILDVTGKPDAVGQLLAKVDRMRKRGELVGPIGIKAPTQEVLAELKHSGTMPGIVSTSNQGTQTYSRPKARVVGQVSLDQLLPPKSIATNGRSIRVLLVVEPAQKERPKGTK